MPKKPFNPNQLLKKAYRRHKVDRHSFESFKGNLSTLLKELDEKEREEHVKNDVVRFLDDTWYKGRHAINTKGDTDLVIHNEPTTKSTVGVLLEVKKPSNKNEMVSQEKLNTKALQELLLYYLRERVDGANGDIRHLVVTNVYEWFIFDASEFYHRFYKNSKLIKAFDDWNSGKKDSKSTDHFYKEIASPFIAAVEGELEYTYFDFRDYTKYLKSEADSRKLIALYKVLSPVHMLKLSVANDSNSLDKKFYHELLHIIGLEEVKEKGKKVIRRKAEGKRNEGSLLENAINIMDERDRLGYVDNALRFGTTRGDQLYNIGLELCITWTNRILFLKLMESQLIAYNKGDLSFKFLDAANIPNFDVLETLFFGVLARKSSERTDRVREKFGHIPYLNSSLFESTELEGAMPATSLDNNLELELYSQTVLRDQKAKKLSGQKDTLTYLFEFLDAYDFSSEGTEDIQEESKTLINASVLGLIFEKINGYKDGSFYTPGFITMYMCQETIRRAVLQKFKEAKGWECKDLVELYDKIEDKKEANEIINSLHICDPAVGSGHFLVSALNELIAIKSELKILLDREGKTLRDYDLSIENDELIVTDDNGDFFNYTIGSNEKRRFQEALFHEKQTIIENCLFGVDINPNSVKICRLRLWIELLKNSYYINDFELETLPNIDINIKCGNSLVSRFGLESDLSQALKKSKWDINTYRNAVHNYKNAQSKDDKKEFEQLIATIKKTFETTIANYDPRKVKMNKLGEKLFKLTGIGRGGTTNMLFDPEEHYGKDKKLKKQREQEIEKIEKEINKLSTEIDEVKNNKVYENAFEWRFEFPEVLGDDGTFLGFDVVIGNPPYIRQEELKEFKTYFRTNYETFAGTADLFVYFIELGLRCLKQEGDFIFIVPNKWMRAGYGKGIRDFLKQKRINSILDFGDLPVFEEATTYPSILSLSNSKPKTKFYASNINTLDFETDLNSYVKDSNLKVITNELQDSGWTLIDSKVQKILSNIRKKGIPLQEIVKGGIFRGIVSGLNEAFVIDKMVKDQLVLEDSASKDIIKPLLVGKDIKRYQKPKTSKYLILSKRGIYIEQYPSVYDHLKKFEVNLRKKAGASKWYELQASPSETEKFELPKIMYPDISKNMNFILDYDSRYNLNTVYNIGSNSKGLLGYLNSHLFRFYFQSVSNSIRGGYMRFFSEYMVNCPVPENIDILEEIVNQILTLKKENPKADTSALEAEIDQMVYGLYGLTQEEIAIVEGS